MKKAPEGALLLDHDFHFRRNLDGDTSIRLELLPVWTGGFVLHPVLELLLVVEGLEDIVRYGVFRVSMSRTVPAALVAFDSVGLFIGDSENFVGHSGKKTFRS